MDMKPEKVEYEFENIFPGSKQISDEILKTINENSLDIFNDVKAGFEEIFSLLYLKYTNSVFSKIPLKDVFLD
ncbi:hypothetical protein NQ314_016598 [Rhamnusium bicolor]|uniref:Uncharacterized protein n=1 Tax=Rhamnusium bicolor TaxID=1586634 RepID=A0AAV8WVU7_9CUCU|nr:hypothetical protein NQ314_016598 [Rhamnusium bicolor]